MTSPLPPRLRDTRSFLDRVRQDRTNLGQLGVGFMGGRFPPLRPLGAAGLLGDVEGDESPDTDTDRILFWNTDQVTATGAGNLTLSLTHEPIDGSLHVRWNGLDLSPTEWTLAGKTVTILDPDFLFVDEDLFTSAYAYYQAVDETAVGGVLNYSLPAVNHALGTVTWSIPENAEIGNTLVMVVFITQEHEAITANGWDFIGQTSLGGGVEPYRLEVYAKDYDGTPTTPATTYGIGDPETVGAIIQIEGGSSVSGIFDFVAAGGSTASTPAGPSTLRVWAVRSSVYSTVTPDSGAVVLSVEPTSAPGGTVRVVVTEDTSTGAVSATASASVVTGGWCLATLAVT